MKWLDNCLLTLAVIGCIVWGLIGFFQFNLVSFIFGNGTWLTRVIYALVGLSGLYLISFYGRIRSNHNTFVKVFLEKWIHNKQW